MAGKKNSKKEVKGRKKVKKSSPVMKNKSTSTSGVVDTFIFQIWEGKKKFKTIQGEIPKNISKISIQLENKIENFHSKCEFGKIYLFISLILFLSSSIFACFESNWYLLNGSAFAFFLTNLFFRNSKKNEVKKFKKKFEILIKQLTSNGRLGKFKIEWRLDFERRRAKDGEMGSLIEEMRFELQILQREIKREESLIVPTASKLLNLDSNKSESESLNNKEGENKKEEKMEEKEVEESESQVINFSFDDLSVASEKHGVKEKEDENELVSVRINGQDLVCFPTRYRIRRPHHPEFSVITKTEEGGMGEQSEEN